MKTGPRDVLIKKKILQCYMDLSCVGMWIVHKLATTKYDGSRAHANKGYNIPRLDTNQQL
jgi:hypothetical protein